MKEFKPQVLTFKSNTVMDGLDKVAKNVLVHIKANKEVYIQIGKIGLCATITAAGLFFNSITGHASEQWANDIDGTAKDAYYGLVSICQWAIIGKAVWDMAVACIHGEMRKAPSIGISYTIVVIVIYAMPLVMDSIKKLFGRG
ncbi:MAG: hypothetical protein K2G70_05945 [Turicibacter sp.]|nr:hypothetical protein [Turicibacter sp.]